MPGRPVIVACVATIARSLPWLAVAALGLGLLAAIVRLAWLSDDAYLTLRCIENLRNGYGPVWNLGERVQVFAHPLWFWLLAGAQWLSGEHYYTTIVLSVGLSGAAVVLLLRTAAHWSAAVALLLLLLGCRSFGDFCTSGLETPLAMLLLVWLARLDERTPVGGVRLGAIAFAVGLCGCTRLDLLCLVAPLLLAHMRRERPLQQMATLGLTLAPLIGWSLFATLYYGSPFPITAFALVFAPGVPALDLIGQGWCYVVHQATHDPVTLLVIGAGLLVGLVQASLRGRMLALGIGLGCLGIVRVGGDGMAGRLFVPPFALALALLARWLANAPPWRALAIAGFGAGVMWLPGTPAFLRAPGDDLLPTAVAEGIQDGRRRDFAKLGLLSPQRATPQPGLFTAALRRQGRQAPLVLGADRAAVLPFVAGELFHFIDPWQCDPLLMRLPMADPRHWRVGEFPRGLPDGYAESIAFGDNRIEHPGLRRYYATLRTVLRGELASEARWQALATLLGGAEDHLRRGFVSGAYRTPGRADVLLDELRTPRAAGTFWFDDARVRCVPRGGLRLRALTKGAAKALHLSVTPGPSYRLRFFDGAREVGRAECAALLAPESPPTRAGADVLGYLRRRIGLQRVAVELPPNLPAFDSILVAAQHEPWLLPALGCCEITP